MKVSKSVLERSGTRFFAQILGFLVNIYFARALGAEILGIFFLYLSVSSLVNIISNIGVGGAIVKRVSETRNTEKHSKFFASSLLILTPIVVIVTMFIFIMRSYLEDYIGADVYIFIIISLWISMIGGVSSSVLTGKGKISLVGVILLLSKIVMIFFQFIFVYFFNLGIFALIYGTILSSIFNTVLILKFTRLKLTYPDFSYIKSLLKFSKFTILARFRGIALNRLDILIIRLLIPDSQFIIGVYGVCWRFSEFLMFFSTSLATVLFPRISRLYSEKKIKSMRKLFERGIEYSPILLIPAFFGTLFLSKNILALIYGRSFVVGWLILNINMLTRVFQSYSGIIIGTLMGMNKPEKVFLTDILSIVLNLSGNLILVYFFGYVGAAVATFLTILFLMILNGYHVLHLLKVSIPYKTIASEYVSAILMLVLVFIFKEISKTKLALIMLILFGAFIYFFLLFLINKEMRNRFLIILQDLRERKFYKSLNEGW